ncbi:uncharacterized protein EDB93DRAFT_740529 [Suillus bovinus]|uniref:uncharacterized protein n=1 Tax=Suillus bovinus TaxID=48563 RepID=UPI001B878EA8|nr:uncharacterized protein EDB93DRAFT_740529 [Suillus bovinus]KAG2158020.1 hypothetical protein EDB93DRAFT_740529 [Suillus bovinus]
MSDPDSSLAYDQPEHDSQDHLPVEGAHWDHNGIPLNSQENWALEQHAPQGPAANYHGANNHLLNPAFTRHTNLSVPSLPSHRQRSEYDDVPPLPNFNPSNLVDSMNAMHLSDPVPRGTSAMSYSSDPVPRAGTSMSMQSLSPDQRGPYPPRYASTLPSAPNMNVTRPLRLRHPAERSHTVDEASLYSSDLHRGLSVDTDLMDMRNCDNQGQSPYPSSESSVTPYSQPPPYPPRQFQVGQQGPQATLPPAYYPPGPGPTHPGPSRQDEYDYLYAAASDVLGMGHPPPQHHMPLYPAGPAYGSQVSLPVSQSTPYLAPPGPGPYGGSAGMLPYGGPPNPSVPQELDDPEFELRPSSLQRSASTSVDPRTKKTKAVDLTAPPFTKEYIDQYRHRIKADPDPEAHFLYAKYLIDAAKKIRADAKDQRAVKKYRDLLLQESLKTIRRLAEQKEAYDEAQFFLANCFGTGSLGLQVDHERAYHLYLQAAKQNHAAASYRVAVCNEIGAGTRRDPQRASAFYRKAASLGDTAAMYKLGMILLLGSLGEQKNPREAINWLKRAAEQADEENPHALHELAMLHEMPNSQLVIHDPAYAKSLYEQAARLGYTQSQYKLGQCYEYGTLTCPVDPRRSIAWYTKAAEKGDAEAELALSGWYLTGSEGVLKQSDSEAYLWARKAANKGLSKAEYAVGYYAEVGIGIKQDVEFAKRWYMRAAAQGNKRAMNRLTEMKRMGNKRSNVGRPTRQQTKDECVIC